MATIRPVFLQPGDNRTLLIRKHLSLDLAHAELSCDGLSPRTIILRQHDHLDAFDRQIFQRRRCRLLHGVRNGEQARQLAVDRDVDDGRADRSKSFGISVQRTCIDA
jgi:hypothetical protein